MGNENPHTSKLLRFDSIEPQEPSYLWRPYLRRANINLLAADGGAGKTTLCFALIAALTMGTQPASMPGELCIGEPVNVVYLGSEDDAGIFADMLEKSGADRSRVYTLDPLETPNIGDTAALEALIRATNARLLVYDPAQAYLASGTDMNRTGNVRPQLEGLRSACKATDCSALLLLHFNKASATFDKASYRVSGSTDFSNAARSVLTVLRHPKEADTRITFQSKTNGLPGEPIMFRIGSGGVFEWLGCCTDYSESECLRASDGHVERQDKPYDPKREAAQNLVCALLRERQAWKGSCAAMLKACPEWAALLDERALGWKLNDPRLRDELREQGIEASKASATSRVYLLRRLDSLGGGSDE